MRTFLILVLTFGLFSLSLNAQKLKSETVKVTYTQLPTKPLNPEFKTYSVSVTDPFGVFQKGNSNAESLVKKYLTLDGFKPLPGGSDFHININVGQYILIEHETQTETTKKTKKVDVPNKQTSTKSTTESTEKKAARQTTPTAKTETVEKTKSASTQKQTISYTVTTYHKNIKYNLPMSYVIIDYQGNKIKQGTLYSSKTVLTHTYGKGTKTEAELNKAFEKKFANVFSGMISKTLNQGVSSLGTTVKKNYDFKKATGNVYMRSLGKKSDGATEFNTAFERVKSSFKKMKADEPIDKIKQEIKPSIDTWNKLKETYPTTKKKGIKGRYACLYNNAVTMFWLEEYDEARKYANEAINLKFRDKPLKRLLENINETKKSLSLNKVKTRHFKRDLENIVMRDPMPQQAAPSNIKNSVAPPSDAIVYDGFITDKKGKKINGKFIISNNKKKELEFGKQGNIKFHYSNNNVPLVSDLSPKEVKSFGFNKRVFNCQNYTTALGTSNSEKKILECLFDSKEIKVFKYYPYEPGINNETSEICLQRSSDEKPISTVGDQFLIFNRGLSEFFKACPELRDLALKGEFEKNEVDIVRAAKAFTQYCRA